MAKDTKAEPKTFDSVPDALTQIRLDQLKAKEENRKRAAAAVGFYEVTLGDLRGVYHARDANEAWAKFCDAHKTWPSPRHARRQVNGPESSPRAFAPTKQREEAPALEAPEIDVPAIEAPAVG